MDVKAVYLHSKIHEEIYLEQPKGFEKLDSNGNKLVCKLRKISIWTEASNQKLLSGAFNFINSGRF